MSTPAWAGRPRRRALDEAPARALSSTPARIAGRETEDRPVSAAAPSFEHFDAKMAERMLAANDALTGLPRYLGIRLLEFTPGRLV
jgi:hypothetical protein